MLDVVRFWLGLGLDGFRLDAVPYLFERDGTNGENLPETHDYLKDAAPHGRRRSSPARCCWPRPTSGRPTSSTTSATATSATCASTSRSCRACSWRCAGSSATRSPRSWPRRPAIPEGCQWGIFLRNHDELTLEMVTDEERDYMYTEYAKDPLMRRNVGIARRLFPLLENDRRVAELFHAMLFSMPGSPVLYYGDEIGMGDNIYLGDRDGVRTPMQWTPDRNAGFSQADFARLYLPPLMDPVYGYQACNVEAELRDPSSFLHWMQAHARGPPRAPGAGRGHVRGARGREPVGARLRAARDRLDHDGQEDIVVCVNNLSRFAQPAELQLGQLAGKQPIELMGRVPFPLDRRAALLRHPAAVRLLLVRLGASPEE